MFLSDVNHSGISSPPSFAGSAHEPSIPGMSPRWRSAITALTEQPDGERPRWQARPRSGLLGALRERWNGRRLQDTLPQRVQAQGLIGRLRESQNAVSAGG
ncbi:MAG TPA: hypothetical protein VKA68_01045, partial [bacterium]|nr:hypothetical protein [bacterium]